MEGSSSAKEGRLMLAVYFHAVSKYKMYRGIQQSICLIINWSLRKGTTFAYVEIKKPKLIERNCIYADIGNLISFLTQRENCYIYSCFLPLYASYALIIEYFLFLVCRFGYLHRLKSQNFGKTPTISLGF
jgi:hypothetical protein